MSLKVVAKFKEYHQENPHVWESFQKYAKIAAEHRSNFSVRAIFEQIRWETMISGSGDYKLWDHGMPYYGRLFEETYPEHKGFFRKKNILPEGFSVKEYLEEP